MIADSENVLYNNPVNIKYTWKREDMAGTWNGWLVISARHFKMVLVLLTKIHQILAPLKSLDKGEILSNIRSI